MQIQMMDSSSTSRSSSSSSASFRTPRAAPHTANVSAATTVKKTYMTNSPQRYQDGVGVRVEHMMPMPMPMAEPENEKEKEVERTPVGHWATHDGANSRDAYQDPVTIHRLHGDGSDKEQPTRVESLHLTSTASHTRVDMTQKMTTATATMVTSTTTIRRRSTGAGQDHPSQPLLRSEWDDDDDDDDEEEVEGKDAAAPPVLGLTHQHGNPIAVEVYDEDEFESLHAPDGEERLDSSHEANDDSQQDPGLSTLERRQAAYLVRENEKASEDDDDDDHHHHQEEGEEEDPSGALPWREEDTKGHHNREPEHREFLESPVASNSSKSSSVVPPPRTMALIETGIYQESHSASAPNTPGTTGPLKEENPNEEEDAIPMTNYPHEEKDLTVDRGEESHLSHLNGSEDLTTTSLDGIEVTIKRAPSRTEAEEAAADRMLTPPPEIRTSGTPGGAGGGHSSNNSGNGNGNEAQVERAVVGAEDNTSASGSVKRCLPASRRGVLRRASATGVEEEMVSPLLFASISTATPSSPPPTASVSSASLPHILLPPSTTTTTTTAMTVSEGSVHLQSAGSGADADANDAASASARLPAAPSTKEVVMMMASGDLWGQRARSAAALLPSEETTVGATEFTLPRALSIGALASSRAGSPIGSVCTPANPIPEDNGLEATPDRAYRLRARLPPRGNSSFFSSRPISPVSPFSPNAPGITLAGATAHGYWYSNRASPYPASVVSSLGGVGSPIAANEASHLPLPPPPTTVDRTAFLAMVASGDRGAGASVSVSAADRAAGSQDFGEVEVEAVRRADTPLLAVKAEEGEVVVVVGGGSIEGRGEKEWGRTTLHDSRSGDTEGEGEGEGEDEKTSTTKEKKKAPSPLTTPAGTAAALRTYRLSPTAVETATAASGGGDGGGGGCLSAGTTAVIESMAYRTSRAEFRQLMLQSERELAGHRETVAQQQSTIAALKDALHQAQDQLSSQAQRFLHERETEKQDRHAQFQSLTDQLRLVRQSAETLLAEKVGLGEEVNRQKERLHRLVEREREEKERIMQEYRRETETIITSQGREITRLRALLDELRESSEISSARQAAAHEEAVHRLEKEKAALQQRLQAAADLEATGLLQAHTRLEQHKDFQRLQEKQRELAQLVQALESQLESQRAAHEAHEADLVAAHRREREGLLERMKEERERWETRQNESAAARLEAVRRESESLREALQQAQEQHQAEMERHTRERARAVEAERERAKESAAAESRRAEAELARVQGSLAKEREALLERVASLESDHREAQETAREQLEEAARRERESVRQAWIANALAERARLETSCFSQSCLIAWHGRESLHRAEMEQLAETLVSLQAVLVKQESVLAQLKEEQRSTLESHQHELHSLQQEHEEELAALEKLMVELRLDLSKSQSMAAQYLKELTLAHREKEQLRVKLEGEVDRLEKHGDALQQELQYRDMMETELQGTIRMMQSRLSNYESENKSLHEEVVELTKKLQEAHLLLGRKDAGINQLRAQLRAFESTSGSSLHTAMQALSTTTAITTTTTAAAAAAAAAAGQETTPPSAMKSRKDKLGSAWGPASESTGDVFGAAERRSPGSSPSSSIALAEGGRSGSVTGSLQRTPGRIMGV